MKKSIIIGLTGAVAGMLIAFTMVYTMAPGLMLLENESKFGFEETTQKFEQSIKDNEWSIIKVHDLQKSMTKHGYEVLPVKVFEFCHPNLAKRILETNDDRIVASMMPCRIAIYEKADGKTYISRMNSGMMAKMMSKLIDEVMGDATSESEKIMRVIIKE